MAPKLIDVGTNLTDPMFRGMYGSCSHPNDLDQVLERARANGVEKIVVTGGNLEDSREALQMATDHADYERLHFCDKATQQRFFELQLRLVQPCGGLPLFLHCRRAGADMLNILRRNRTLFNGGVVHSFTDSREDAASFLELGLHISLNGCSLKTAENLDVAASIPGDRLVIGTDSPWCEIRPKHAGAKYVRTSFPTKKKEQFQPGFMVSGRNEPAKLVCWRFWPAFVEKTPTPWLPRSTTTRAGFCFPDSLPSFVL
ncbi:deoxyribonuclease TATDN1-like isoform X3 [Haemaphysalis longicornis]